MKLSYEIKQCNVQFLLIFTYVDISERLILYLKGNLKKTIMF